MIRSLLRLVIDAVILQALAELFWPHVYISSFAMSFVLSLVLHLLYKLVYPVLKFLAFPINLLTLGLFKLVLNGFIFVLAQWLLGNRFWIQSFGYAVLFALVYAILQSIVTAIIGGNETQ